MAHERQREREENGKNYTSNETTTIPLIFLRSIAYPAETAYRAARCHLFVYRYMGEIVRKLEYVMIGVLHLSGIVVIEL